MRSATQGEKAVLVKELREERYRLNDLLDAIGLFRPTCYYELGKTDRAKERNASYRLKFPLFSTRTEKDTA
jgi:hypothetical protein